METDYEFTTNWLQEDRARIWLSCLDPLRGKDSIRYLEIGSFEGRSLLWMLENVLTHPRARAVVVDLLFEPHGSRLLRNLKKSGHERRVTIHRDFSEKVLPQLRPADFDIIYVDGGHQGREVHIDLVHSWRALKTGGFLILDDVRMEVGRWPVDLIPASPIDSFLTAFRHELVIHHFGYQVILRKRAPHRSRVGPTSFFGPYAYDWNRRALEKEPHATEVPLTEGERLQLEAMLRELRVGWVELDVNAEVFRSESAIALMSKLAVERKDFLIGAWPGFPLR